MLFAYAKAVIGIVLIVCAWVAVDRAFRRMFPERGEKTGCSGCGGCQDRCHRTASSLDGNERPDAN